MASLGGSATYKLVGGIAEGYPDVPEPQEKELIIYQS